MRFVVSLTALSVLLGACAQAPLPQPTGPTTATTVSRTMFQRGIQGGGQNVPPSLVERTYTLACGPASDGATAEARRTRAIAIIERESGLIGQAGIGDGYQRSFEQRAVNPALVAGINCTATNVTLRGVTTDQLQIAQFIIGNNLTGQLAAMR